MRCDLAGEWPRSLEQNTRVARDAPGTDALCWSGGKTGNIYNQ
jgi:hypothetical protein